MNTVERGIGCLVANEGLDLVEKYAFESLLPMPHGIGLEISYGKGGLVGARRSRARSVRSLGHVDGSLMRPRQRRPRYSDALNAALHWSERTENPSERIERVNGYAHTEEHPGTPSS